MQLRAEASDSATSDTPNQSAELDDLRTEIGCLATKLEDAEAKRTEAEQASLALESEVTRLEGALADARAEVCS